MVFIRHSDDKYSSSYGPLKFCRPKASSRKTEKPDRQKSTKKWITYTIKKDRTQSEIDPWYDDMFEEPLKIKIRKN